MFQRRHKRSTGGWAGLVGLAVALAGGLIWLVRGFLRRQSRPADWRRPVPLHSYGLESAPGIPDAELGLPYAFTQEEQPGGQVPVTAKRPQGRGAQQRGAKSYPTRTSPGQPSGSPGESERRPFPWLLALFLTAILAGGTFFLLEGRQPARAQVIEVPGGDPENGRRAMQSWGCGACHTIPGVPGALGKVGPQLNQMAEQTYIAGMLPNTPDNMVRWIMDPQEIQPGNAMPDTNVAESTARDMAAYLYSIR